MSSIEMGKVGAKVQEKGREIENVGESIGEGDGEGGEMLYKRYKRWGQGGDR